MRHGNCIVRGFAIDLNIDKKPVHTHTVNPLNQARSINSFDSSSDFRLARVVVDFPISQLPFSESIIVRNAAAYQINLIFQWLMRFCLTFSPPQPP